VSTGEPTNPAFSVVIPTWNRVELVRQAIASVLRQTWADFELVVVDDGSTDGTAAALADITDRRVRLLVRRHEGVAAARNAGAAAGRGALLAFLDSDDEALPSWLEGFATVLRAGANDVVICGATVLGGDGSSWSLPAPMGRLVPDRVAPRFLAGCYSLRRELFEAVGGFDASLEVGENTELALRLFTRRPQPRFAAIRSPLVYLRAPATRSQSVRAAGAATVLARHANGRASFPKLWASYNAMVGVGCVQERHFWRGRYYFLRAVRSDPRSLEQLGRLGVSLIPGGSHLVWRSGLMQGSAGHLPRIPPNLARTVRRHAEEVADQAGARAYHRVGPRRHVAPFDGDPRLAIVTVNFSTTRYLKLMLCTLADQSALWFVQQVVVVDNGSRDGGVPFLRALARRVPRLYLVERRHFLNHAAGMRSGLRALARIDGESPEDQHAGIVVFCDPDVIFRNGSTLLDLSAAMIRDDAAFAGEARLAPPSVHPDVQASFFAVRRDALARRDVEPLVNHGSPAYRLQASVLRSGLTIVDFPSNHGGYILHRGRTAVAAATTYHVGSYAGVANREPHFMGVPGGPSIWADIEQRWAPLLNPAAEPALLDHLADRFAVLGSDREPSP
jgi:glycosyltransferase involved in cell wall biosynthesis